MTNFQLPLDHKCLKDSFCLHHLHGVCFFQYVMWSEEQTVCHHPSQWESEMRGQCKGQWWTNKETEGGKGECQLGLGSWMGFFWSEKWQERRLKLKMCHWTRGNPSHPLLLKGFSWRRERWRAEEWEGKDWRQGWRSFRPATGQTGGSIFQPSETTRRLPCGEQSATEEETHLLPPEKMTRAPSKTQQWISASHSFS